MPGDPGERRTDGVVPADPESSEQNSRKGFGPRKWTLARKEGRKQQQAGAEMGVKKESAERTQR